MEQINWLDHLKALLNPDTPVGRLQDHLKAMHTAFESILGNKQFSKEWTQTPTGSATSPADAATCFKDTLRTIKYFRAVHQGIEDLQTTINQAPLHVVYAGCGPFAPLVLPLCALFPPEELCITLMDIHQESLDGAKKLASALGLTRSIHSYLCEDASSYRFPKDVPIHMVVTETLVQGLIKEGYVSIVHNFSDQISDQGILIPECIAIDAKYLLPEKEYAKQPPSPAPGISGPQTPEIRSLRRPLGRVFEVSLEKTATWPETAYRDSEGNLVLPANTIDLPDPIPLGHTLALFTEIQLYKDICLQEYESGLTHPLLTNVRPQSTSRQISFCYVVNTAPSLYVLDKGELCPL